MAEGGALLFSESRGRGRAPDGRLQERRLGRMGNIIRPSAAERLLRCSPLARCCSLRGLAVVPAQGTHFSDALQDALPHKPGRKHALGMAEDAVDYAAPVAVDAVHVVQAVEQ
eukprot:9147252-Alexandrium_andersonii.AAC.1